MRRLLIVLLIVLAGCSVDIATIKPTVDDAINQALEAKTPTVLNQKTPYYSYYLPPHMGTRFVNEVASVLVANEVEIVLQMDVPSIISERFYAATARENVEAQVQRDYFYEYEGDFIDSNERRRSLLMQIQEIDHKFVVYMKSNHFVISSYVSANRLKDVVNDMLVVLRSAVANQDKVIQNYSNKQVINYQQQVIEMFEQVAPESGTVADMDRLIQGELDFSEYVNEGEEEGIDIPDTNEDEEDTE